MVLDFFLSIVILMFLSAAIALFLYRPHIVAEIINGQAGQSVLDLSHPPLSLTFDLAGPSFQINQPVSLNVSYKNNGAGPISHWQLALSDTDQAFSISRIRLLSGQGSVSGDSLTLPDLAPGETGTISLLINFSATDSNARTLNWQLVSAYTYNDQNLSATQTLKPLDLQAQLNVSAVAYYNSPQGDQLGAGPLPPVVGLPTNYWIFWEAKSDGDFKDLAMSGRLPQGVELTGARTLLAGQLKYNTSTRQLIWQVPDIKGGSDIYRAGFEIQLVPTSSQLAHVPMLMAGLKYFSTDALSAQEASGTLPDLSANLDFDRFNKGQGKVAK